MKGLWKLKAHNARFIKSAPLIIKNVPWGIAVGACAGLVVTGALLVSAPSAHAASLVDDYLIIATGDSAALGEHVLTLSDAEIGAIDVDGPPPSPPQGNPPFPDDRLDSQIGLDGDIALTNVTATLSLSNTDVHAISTGPGNPGSQGIDCASSFIICTTGGSQISSNNQFNTASPTPSFSTLAENNGVQGNIDLAHLEVDLAGFKTPGLSMAHGPKQTSRDFIPAETDPSTQSPQDFVISHTTRRAAFGATGTRFASSCEERRPRLRDDPCYSDCRPIPHWNRATALIVWLPAPLTHRSGKSPTTLVRANTGLADFQRKITPRTSIDCRRGRVERKQSAK